MLTTQAHPHPIVVAGAALVALATLSFDVAAESADARSALACTESHECADQLGYGHVCRDGECKEYVDRTDILEAVGLVSEAPEPEKYGIYPVILPALGFNPALGFVGGVLGNLGIYLGDPDDTTISQAGILALYTTKQQLVLKLVSTLMTPKNEWELQGDWRAFIYNQSTYGLGSGTPPVVEGFPTPGGGRTAPLPGPQPMDFNLIRVHETVLRLVGSDLYFGGSYRLDHHFAIVDEELDLLASPPHVTSYHAYTEAFGFDLAQSTVSGVALDVLYDSRDSTINPYRGVYAKLSYGIFPTWLGSDQNSTTLTGELRNYLGLSENMPRNVLALRVRATGILTGNQPYLALPSTGWDAHGTTGRGYVQGRFRGTSEAYAEVEWRFPILNSGVIGGTVFANASTFARPSFDGAVEEAGESLFDSIKPAGGVGLRLLVNKLSRTNVRFDAAWGVDSFGFYMDAGDTF